MQSVRNGGVQAEPNVIPLIDIMMVLLIIFMLLTATQYEAMFAQVVPEAEHGEDPAAATRLILEVGDGGRYAINREFVSADSLGSRLRQLYRNRPDKTLLVRGDGDARYQEIVTAIDVARDAGVQVVGLWTRPK